MQLYHILLIRFFVKYMITLCIVNSIHLEHYDINYSSQNVSDPKITVVKGN